MDRKHSHTLFNENSISMIGQTSRSCLEKTVIQDPINNSNFIYMNYEISVNTNFLKHDDVFSPVSAEIFIKNNCNFDI